MAAPRGAAAPEVGKENAEDGTKPVDVKQLMAAKAAAAKKKKEASSSSSAAAVLAEAKAREAADGKKKKKSSKTWESQGNSRGVKARGSDNKYQGEC